MATKRGEKRAGVIVDGSGNKISRSAVNAQLVSVMHISSLIRASDLVKSLISFYPNG